MDPLDAAMMTAEVLSNPLHVAALLILAPPEDAGPGYVDQLYRDGLGAADMLDPRLRRHPHRGLDTGGIWVWREAENLDLGQHVQRRTLPPGAGKDALWRLVGELHAEPLDRSRPMWMSCLIDGLPGGRFAYYLKVHHTVVDGVAGFQLIEDALSADPDRRSMRPFFVPRPNKPPGRTGARGLLRNPIPLVRSVVGAAAGSVGVIRQVVAGEVSNLVGSLITKTTVLPFDAPYTRFNGRLGPERAFAAGSWSKDRIRAVQKAAEVTANDVLTAVVAGVLREWLIAHDELPNKSLVAICPITVRGREHGPGHGDAEGSANMFGAELCPLGTDVADPAERLALIHRAMSWAKQQVASRGSGATMLLLAPSIAPTVLLPMLRFAPKLRTGYNLPISNVPGPQQELYWNGAHVEEIYPVSAVYDGMALNVTVCVYADRFGFGYVAGRDVMPDIETLVPLTERCLAELETAVGVPP
jgi:WS/DGAT/MGAT family acyltransferase